MTDHADSDASSDVAGPWLSPSEALTRFVPGGQMEAEGVRAIAPIRFGVRIGDIGLLVPSGMLSELLDSAEIYPMPTTPLWFRGLINLRGNLVPVFDLKTLFEMGDQSAETTNLLVLNTGEEAVGILIDGLPVTLDATQSLDHFPPLPPVLRESSQAVYMWDEEVWVEFDFDGLFRSAARQTVA